MPLPHEALEKHRVDDLESFDEREELPSEPLFRRYDVIPHCGSRLCVTGISKSVVTHS
jgi:hypothetical protein